MTTPDPTHVRCPVCGDVVGMYEPAISVTADGTRLHGIHHGRSVVVVAVYHRDCLEPAER